MEALSFDILSIYAYADEGHARERELWRGFLGYALPVVLALKEEDVEHLIAESIVYQTSELTTLDTHDVDIPAAVRSISVLLGKEIGVKPEFAMASFFEGELPTKLHKVYSPGRLEKKNQNKQEDLLISNWLASLVRLQQDGVFKHKVEKWKTWLAQETLSEAV